ncbi:MAG: TIM-barrel domain-containing protein [Kiritimatiellia bacterium]
MNLFRLMVCGIFVGLPAFAAVQTATFVTSYNVETNAAGNRQIFFQLNSGGTVEVTPYAPDVVRVRFHFAGLYERPEVAIDKLFQDWPAFSQTFSEVNPTNFLIITDELQIRIAMSDPFRVDFYTTNNVPILLDDRMEFDLDYSQLADTNAYEQFSWGGGSFSVSNFPSGFKLRGTRRMEASDAFFGLGDTAGPLNRRGRAIQFWAQDTYAFAEDKTPRYTALPMMYGVRPAATNNAAIAYGFFFNNPARPVFRLDREDELWTFEAGDDQLDYFFFSGGSSHTMATVIDRFSELTGRPKMMPKWALGYHQSRHSYFSQDEVMGIANAMRNNDFPGDAIYLDIGAQAQFTTYTNQNAQLTFNADYTNVPGLVADASAFGIKLVPIVEPLLTLSDPLYEEAATNLYFLKANDLSNYVGTNFLGIVSWLDYSIPATRDWWRGKLVDYVVDYGFEGIWNDLNEPNENDMPLDTIWFLDGTYGITNVENTIKWHAINKNTYNIWESQVTYDALVAANPAKRPFVLSRGAWPGIQKYAAGWSGDNLSSFDHLRFSNAFGLNVMLSGQAWYGHDIGGFVDNAWETLVARWTQAGVLQPLFRNHSTLDTLSQEPWVYGADDVAANRRWIKFRYQMMPYLYALAEQTHARGIPLNTPTVFHFQGDTNTYARNDDEYMVGPDLLVAPVVNGGDYTREVYLPAGADWYHWDTQTKYNGGQTVTVPASSAYLPLFSRDGAIIPRGPVQYYANEFQPDYLDILHWPGTNNFELYEDDGETTNYLAGVFARTRFEADSSTNHLNFTVHAREGSYDTGIRDFYLVAHDLSPVRAIYLDGNALNRRANRAELEAVEENGWSYAWHDRQLTVKFADTLTEQVVTADFDEPLVLTEPVYSTVFSNMAVAGTYNLWNQRAANLRPVGTNEWGGVIDLSGWTNIVFKFVGDDTWGNSWGNSSPSGTVPPLSNEVASSTGNNIQLTGSYTGWYTFTFNDITKRYSIVSAWDSDLDGDGMPDAFEAYHGLNPYAPGDADLDPDDDKFDNLEEYIAGTSIIGGDSYFLISGLSVPAGTQIGWDAVSGRLYNVWFATNLLDPSPWSLLIPFTNQTGIGPISVTDTNPASFNYYRINVTLP